MIFSFAPDNRLEGCSQERTEGNNIVECCLQFIPQHIQKRKVGSYNLRIIDRNIFSLKLPKNENIQPGPEKQYSYIKKSKRKE